jgi:hypothetical protein
VESLVAKIAWPRILLGFVIAPLVVPVFYFVYAAITERNQGASEFVGTLLNYGPYAYLFALVLGLPAFWLLRRNGYAGLWTYALAAGIIGLVGSSLMSLIGMKVAGVLVGTLSGVVTGIVFYLVAFL